MNKWRFVISTTLIILTIIVGITGVLLYLAPSGPGVYILGLPKEKITNLHTVMGFLMLGVILAHLTINWKLYTKEGKKFMRR